MNQRIELQQKVDLHLEPVRPEPPDYLTSTSYPVFRLNDKDEFVRTKQRQTVRWAEYVFPWQKEKESGIVVVIAAIAVPAYGVFFGASACSPGDYYNDREGKGRALGRARQNAARFLSGAKIGKSLVKRHDGAGAFFSIPSPDLLPTAKEIRNSPEFQSVFSNVVFNARRRYAAAEMKKIKVPLSELSLAIYDLEAQKKGKR